MKELKTHQIALTFAGCFLGAGFISGQELWQFFVSFGKAGILGIILALALLFSFGVILFSLVQMTGICEMNKIVLGFESPFLERLSALLQCGVLIGITIVMTAGIGTLFHEMTGLPAWIMSLIASALCAVIVFYGLSGLLSFFSVCVPLIVMATVVFALYMLKNGLPSVPEPSIGRSALLPNWWVSAITYAALNSFGSIGILAPFGPHITGTRKVKTGVFLGSLILGAVAVSVIILMLSLPDPGIVEMPVLTVAGSVSGMLGAFFAILLSLGMFSCALSSLVALDQFLCAQFVLIARHRIFSIAVTATFAFSCSFVGFSSLIGLVYPVLGYMGFVFVILLFAHFIRAKRIQRSLERS